MTERAAEQAKGAIYRTDILISENIGFNPLIKGRSYERIPFFHKAGEKYCSYLRDEDLKCPSCSYEPTKEEKFFINMWKFKNK